MRPAWDYLIVTAANKEQARAYREQLGIRRDLGLISGVEQVLVVPDTEGRRIGSGGSTILCLLEVVSRELGGMGKHRASPAAWQEALARVRVLIVHAGGDARRLPAYSPCGKIFVPVPGESDSALGPTLLDRQLPRYLSLPAPGGKSGQVVVTSGDVFLEFDSSRLDFGKRGLTAVGCFADPGLASAHGVFCPAPDGRVRRFLQKPSLADQGRLGAIDRHGRSLLDIGIMSLDAAAAVRLLAACHPRVGSRGRLVWTGRAAGLILRHGLDFYREIACAMGSDTNRRSYIAEVRRTGSVLKDGDLRTLYDAFSPIPLFVETVPSCIFLHFGTMRQLMGSGADLISLDKGVSNSHSPIILNSHVGPAGAVIGKDGWVEGCRVEAPLRLGGENIVVGVNVDKDLTLPPGACLDVLQGKGNGGKRTWFVRCYDADDLFHLPRDRGGRLNGRPLKEWLRVMDVNEDEVWDTRLSAEERTVWKGRFFPVVNSPAEARAWLWLFDLPAATELQKSVWRESRRLSLSDMAGLASQEAFHSRRIGLRSAALRSEPARCFLPESDFSAADLGFLLENSSAPERSRWLSGILREAYRRHGPEAPLADVEGLGLSRILHTLGTTAGEASGRGRTISRSVLTQTGRILKREERNWLDSQGLSLAEKRPARTWAKRARQAAFEHLGKAIVRSGRERTDPPKNALREDEIVWGRAPARLDLGGGWTDTPPYSLERGGCVINAAVNLNGQAPIQAYARVIPEPEIRINSIDHSARIVIREFDQLLDYRQPASRFGLAKAALALCGFSPDGARRKGTNLRLALERFGGGVELTTLAAIPSGSGLGTSSIMGAALISVISRLAGRSLSQRELFHAVLRLEQELTTGGGWQDQVGGVTEGVKVIRTGPGMVPDPLIHFVPADVLDPRTNGGLTLLYYTGLRRLAKNILADIVGRYLNRDRESMRILRDIHLFPPVMAEAMAEKSVERFGRLIDAAWTLKKELDPESTTPVIESILERVRTHIFGATLLGAGGGGFLLLVCRSADDVEEVRRRLTRNPPNERARFFDFDINREGLVVTVC